MFKKGTKEYRDEFRKISYEKTTKDDLERLTGLEFNFYGKSNGGDVTEKYPLWSILKYWIY